MNIDSFTSEPMEIDKVPTTTAQPETDTKTIEYKSDSDKNDIQETMAETEEKLASFLGEVETAEQSLDAINKDLENAQQKLLKEFVVKSLHLMNQHNTSLRSIHNQLSTVKLPLRQIFLNKCVSIPCDELEELSKETNPQAKKWGTAVSNEVEDDDSRFNYFDLGVPKILDNSTLQSTTNMDTDISTNIDTNMNINTESLAPFTNVEMDQSKEKMELDETEFANIESVSGEQIDIVLNRVKDLRTKERKRESLLEEQKKRIESQAEKAQEQQANAISIIEMVPWVTIKQATALLEMQNTVQQAIEYCISTDLTQVCSEISNYIIKKKSLKNNGLHNNGKGGWIAKAILKSRSWLFGGRSSLDKRVLTRSQTDSNVKSVVLRVMDINDDGSVTLHGVLDRNQIPLDPQHAQVLRLSLRELMDSNMQFVEEEIVQFHCQSNVLQVIFQIMNRQNQWIDDYQEDMGGYQQTNHDESEFTPISLQPKVREMEYKFEFDTQEIGNQSLKSVSHITDGVVLFQGKYDDGSLGLVGIMASDTPIELYTQIIDEETHNILMILIDDIRDDISIEVKNLTNINGLTLEDCMDEFGRDALGRKLCYRIVVKDGQVIGVLAPLGDEIKQLPFLEHRVPSEGSFVKIQNGNRIGIVKNIPTGLIVTNNPKDDFKKTELQYPCEETTIFRKHVADLHGFIDCEIVCNNGEWILERPDYKAFMITELELADDNVQMEYFQNQASLRSEVTNNFTSLLEKVDTLVSQLKNKSYIDTGGFKNIFKEATETLQTVKNMRVTLVNKHQDSNDSQISLILNESQSKITNLERELRVLRFEVNMM